MRVYPTYLIFDANGKIIHRFAGSSDGSLFLDKVAKALSPETQYYVLLDKYKAGKKDTAFLHSLALSAADAYDMETASAVASEYIAAQTNLYTKNNLDFIFKFTQTSKDKGFDLMLNHGDKIDSIRGEEKSKNLVRNIILREEIYPILFKKGVPKNTPKSEPDWAAIQMAVEKKFPAMGKEVLAYSKVAYYQRNNDWKNFAPAVLAYMKLYGSKESDTQLNEFAWTVFENCDDMACLAEALEWSKRSFATNQDPAFIDTYANILYKMG